MKILKLITQFAEKNNYEIYLVGGPVRDKLLHRANKDLDILLDTTGSIEPFVGKFVLFLQIKKARIKKVVHHTEFRTATIYLAGAEYIDITGTRKETYNTPGQLPAVSPGTLHEDLSRRDFTINTLALGLAGKNKNRIIDLFSGRKDLSLKKLEVLHDASFIDDPTRILRAIRFIARYGLTFDTRTELLFKTAVADKTLLTISKERIKNELMRLLSEKNYILNLKLLLKYGIINHIHRELVKMNLSAVNKKTDLSISEKLVFIFIKYPADTVKRILKELKFGKNITNEVYTAISCISGNSSGRIPAWVAKFAKKLHITVPKSYINGNDLIRMGFRPGIVFRKIFADLKNRPGLNSKKEVLQYIKQKYVK